MSGVDPTETVPEDEPILEEGESPGYAHDLGTHFCPECGRENASSCVRCLGCGRSLLASDTPAHPDDPHRELRGAVVGTVAAICVGAVVLAWLGDFSMHLRASEVQLIEGDRTVSTQVLGSNASFTQVFGLALAFALAGLSAALVFGGRYLREVVLGASAGLFVQFLLWVYMVRASGATLRTDLWVAGEGFVMRGPAPILLSQLLLLFLFAAMSAAFGAWIVREQVTGQATCIHCHNAYALRPKPPLRCPKCDAEQTRDGVQWPWVMGVSLVTTLCFALLVTFLREPLNFALECQGQMSEACAATRADASFTVFVTSMRADGFAFWAVNMWRYISVSAPLMLLAPMALSLVVKRGSRASAGALIPINWLFASFVIMLVLSDISSSEAGFIYLMRMQVLALLCWGAVGVLAVVLGDKLRYRNGSAYLDELDD